MDDNTTPDDDEEWPQLPLRLVGFDETVAVYANDVHVSVDPMGFQLVFTQYLPAPLLSAADRERVREQGSYPTQVVARVILPPPAALWLAQSLLDRIPGQREAADNYVEWLENYAAGEEEAEDGGAAAQSG